eukprot:scaffold217222_cov24-Prasinocladus_malaysianus.AAC.1
MKVAAAKLRIVGKIMEAVGARDEARDGAPRKLSSKKETGTASKKSIVDVEEVVHSEFVLQLEEGIRFEE